MKNEKKKKNSSTTYIIRPNSVQEIGRNEWWFMWNL